MSGIDDDDIDSIAQQVLANWNSTSSSGVKQGLDVEEQAIARRLLGHEDAKRFLANPRGQRFRPRRSPRVHHVEVWYSHDSPGGGWSLDVVQDGKKRAFSRDLDEHFCARAIERLQKLGHRVVLMQTETAKMLGIAMPRLGRTETQAGSLSTTYHYSTPSAHQQPSMAKENLKRLAGFKL